jgi:hypothetical protein
MLLLNNKKESELITCLQLSCGNCTYDDIRVFIAKRRNIDKKRVLITLFYNSNIVKIEEDQMNEIFPLGMIKARIMIDIQPSELEIKIARLFDNFDFLIN